MAWNNADGLYQRFGEDHRTNPVNRARDVSTLGAVKQMVLDFDLSKITAVGTFYPRDLNNDGTADGFHVGDPALPAYASVLRTTVVMSEAAASAGLATLTVGTFAVDGTAIDADGLVTTTEGAKANLDTIGKRVYGAGAYVATTAGTASVGSADAYIGLTVGTAVFTAGKGCIIIEYVDPLGV